MRRPVVRSLALVVFLMLLPVVSSLPDVSAQTNRGMGVSPEALPQALRDLSPRDSFVPSSEKRVGVIHALEGKVVVVHGVAKTAYFGMAGDAIYEKDSLHTLGESRCRIRFVDEDVVTMAPDTEFSVDSFQDQRAEGKKSSLFTMAKGKAMFYAMRLFRYRDTRFTVNTPTVTVGVRGTKFGAHVYFAGDDKRAGRGVQVADLGNEIAPYLAQAGPGQSFTNAFSEDGTLDVGGQPVLAGQMFNGQTGQVIPTPPSVIRSFQQATGMGPQGRQVGTTEEGGGEGPPLGLGIPDPGLLADLTSLVTDQTNLQTGGQTELAEKKEEQIVPYTGTLYGYFAALLRKNPLRDAFLNYQPGYAPGITGVNHNEDPLTDLRMHSVMNSSDYIDFSGSGSSPDTACIGGSCANFLEGDPGGTITYLGQNAYAQWGYWMSNEDTSFTITGGNSPGTYSAVNDAVWFVEAKHITTQTEIAAVAAGDYAYSGAAHGTYYNGSAAATMNGNFTSTVHFGSASVRDFNLNVSGGGHSASFVQSGTASVMSSSSGNYFATNSGTATIDGSSVSYKQVSGSLVGSGAEGMIGAWGMSCSSSGVGAAGIYSGTRQ